MRIGIDGRLWNETGVGRYIRNLVWQLQDLDKKNSYVLFVEKGFKIEDVGFKNERWSVVETDIHWHTVEEQLLFHKVLENEYLDLMHFPYFSVPLFYTRPFVITIHDLIINHFSTGKASTLPYPVYYLKRMGYKYIIKQAAKRAEKVIAVSEATKMEIVQHLGVFEKNVIVTYEGVEEGDKGKGERGKKRTLSFTLDASAYFLYVGNAYPHKNVERLVDAFALIAKEYADVKLVFVGKEDYFYRRLKEKVASLGLEQRIIFTGYASEDALQEYYRHAIATILPSLMEGFGLPGLEAMQQKCLVIASDIPVFKEIYRDAALYFDPLVVTSIHATIRKVLEKPYSFDFYKKRGERRIAHFSWKKMAEETLKVYESSIGVRSNQ